MEFRFKKVRETIFDKAHTLVYEKLTDKLLGYYIHDTDTMGLAKWFFCTKSDLPYFVAQTQKEIIETLNRMGQGKPTKLTQYFGLFGLYNIEDTSTLNFNPKFEDSFWYYDKEILSVKLPKNQRLIVESRGEIRVKFPTDSHYLEGHQAVKKAIELKYNDKKINHLDWDMNNWFAVVIIDDDTNSIISDDLGIAHDYHEAIDILIEVYDEL